MPEMVVDASKLPYNEHGDKVQPWRRGEPIYHSSTRILALNRHSCQSPSPSVTILLFVSVLPAVSKFCIIPILQFTRTAIAALNLNSALSTTSQGDHMLLPKTQTILS
jgi:hypothetical protein